jgi:ABC-type branched-subunit amino acid transport system substrate-binding protein
MMTTRILLLRPDGKNPSAVDQASGAKLAASENAQLGVVVEEIFFRRGDLGDLEKQLEQWAGKVSGIVGATSVPESTRLAKLAERMETLCFVANNNPTVWQGRRHVFHIGFPSSQTAAAVAALIDHAQRRRVLLIYDDTDFQRRVAAHTKALLEERHLAVVSKHALTNEDFETLAEWQPQLIYIVFSSEAKARSIARRVRRYFDSPPLLFGRSLLRESFLRSIDQELGETWFVDMFRRGGKESEPETHFQEILALRGINIPTANHAFGWDGVSFCALALAAGRGNPAAALDYLESGIRLQGVTGACSFSPDNHNGRRGPGPTTLTRWRGGRLEPLELSQGA